MTFWVDAQLPPRLAAWSAQAFDCEAVAIRDHGLRDAKDAEIFDAARQAGVTVISKDADFVELVERQGAPPQVLWVTCGNSTNARLREILTQCLPDAMALLQKREPVVEISDPT